MVRARLVVLLACLGWFAGCAETQHPGDETASSDDDVPRHTSHRHKKKKKHVAEAQSGDDDDAPKKHKKSSGDDDDDDAPKKPAKKATKKHASDDDDDDDGAAAKKKAAAKKAAEAKRAAEERAAAKKEAAEEAKEKAAEQRAEKKKAAEEKAAAKKEAAEERAEKKKEAEDQAKEKAAEERAEKKKAAEDDTPKISDDDDDEESAVKPKAAKAKAKAKADDGDDEATKPKVAVKAKAKSDDDDEAKPNRKVVVEDKPEPPKKPRSIEEDVAIDDPLKSAPPVRTATSDEEGDDSEEDKVTSAAPVAVPKVPALQDRSLTTPAGQLDLHAGLPISVLSITDATGMSTSSTSTGLALGVAYGVNAKAEVGFDYTLGISPGAVKGPITLHGAYSLQHGKLDFAAAAALAIDFADVVNPTTMTTTTDTSASLGLGAWVRYHATPTVSLFSGLPALPNATSSVTKLAFPLPVLPYQLQIGVSGGAPIALTLPVGLGYQASPKLYTFASLNLANIRIANTSNAFLFKDFIPIAIGGFYQLDTLSIGGSFSDDLKQGFGYLRFELVARYLLH